MTTTTTRPKTSTSFTNDAVRIVSPIYISLPSRHLAKKILNSLRSLCNAPAGEVPMPSTGPTISVQHSTVSQAQIDLEKRLGISLHVLRSFLLGSTKEGVPIDLLLRIQREITDYTFLDVALIEQAQRNSLVHYLSHAGYSEAEFKKLKSNYIDDDAEQ